MVQNKDARQPKIYHVLKQALARLCGLWACSRYFTLTFLADHELYESLLVVAFCNDVHKDIVLLEEAIDLVVLVLKDGASAMPSNCREDVLFLRRLWLLLEG